MAFEIVLYQVVIMYLLMFTGFFAFKIHVLTDDSCGHLTQFLINFVGPVVIFMSFQIKFSHELLHGLLIAGISAFVTHIIVISMSFLVFNKHTVSEVHRKALQFGVVYSNCGFIGIPLLAAVMGTKGVFYASVYLISMNVFMWTHGIMVFVGKTDVKSTIKAIVNPCVCAIFVGFVFFIFSIQVPRIIHDGMQYIYNLNTPLAMIVIGCRMAQIDLRSIFIDAWSWIGTAIRNLLIPIAALFLLHLAGVSGPLLLGCLLPIACPVGSNTVLFAGMAGCETKFPTKLMSLSTLFSIVSIPLTVYISSALHF